MTLEGPVLRAGRVTRKVSSYEAQSGNVTVPDRCSDVPLAVRLIVEIVDGHKLAVGAQYSPGIPEVVIAAIRAQGDLLAPGNSAIGADPRPDTRWDIAVAVGDAQAPVREPIKGWRVPPTPVFDAGRLKNLQFAQSSFDS